MPPEEVQTCAEKGLVSKTLMLDL